MRNARHVGAPTAVPVCGSLVLLLPVGTRQNFGGVTIAASTGLACITFQHGLASALLIDFADMGYC